VKLARHKAELSDIPPRTLYTLNADSFSEVKQTGQLLESVGIMARAFVTDLQARMKACGITDKDINSASMNVDADISGGYSSEDKVCAQRRGLKSDDKSQKQLGDGAVSEIDKDLLDAQSAISLKDRCSEDLILAAAKIASDLNTAQSPVRASGADGGTFSGVGHLESKLQRLPVSYALKIVYKGRGREKGFLDSILNEAKMLASQPLEHPFIVKMYGKFQTDDALVLAMERLPTIDLWALLHQEKPSEDVSTLGDRQNYEDALPVKQVQFYVASVASALSHLHSRGIAYRNLKPENVMLDERGFIRLVGFGLAKKYPFANEEGRLQVKSYTVCGTAEYLAPEVVLMNGHNTAADAWALGIFMCELITGTTPFREASEVMRTRQTGRRMIMKLKDGDCHIMAAIADAQVQ
jgi:serine/threonine protein kinase